MKDRKKFGKQVKQGLCLAGEVVAEVGREAARLERSFGWVVRHAWRLARDQVRAMPAAPSSGIKEDRDECS